MTITVSKIPVSPLTQACTQTSQRTLFFFQRGWQWHIFLPVNASLQSQEKILLPYVKQWLHCLIKRYQLPASIPYVWAHIAHHAPYIQVQLPFRNIISRITWILIMYQVIRSPSSLTAFAQSYLQKKIMISLFSRDVLECKVIPCWVTC